jgi:GNAT superfamily N-acetyltransferase
VPEIRSALPADYLAVAALWGQYHPGAALTEAEFCYDLPTYTVAVEDGAVAGFCCGHHASGAWLECRVFPAPPADWDCSYLEALGVDEARRGQGIGTALMEDFIARARAAGRSWLLLYPKQGNGRPVASKELRRFYSRAGLHLLDPREDSMRERPWMMGRPLVERPRHSFSRSSITARAA